MHKDKRNDSAAVLAALSRMYYVLYDVDLEADSFVRYQASKLISDVTDRCASARECLQALAMTVFAPEQRQTVASFLDMSTWPERLKDRDDAYLETIGVRTGWVRVNLIAASRDAAGCPTHVLITVRDVNEKKTGEIAHEAKLTTQITDVMALNAKLSDSLAEQALQITEIRSLNRELSRQKDTLAGRLDTIQSLTKVYKAAYYVDVESNTYYELSAEKGIHAFLGDYTPVGRSQETLNRLCDMVVYPEYREAMRAFTDYSTISERMRGTEEISVLYRSTQIGWARAYFIAGERWEDGRLKTCTFVIRDVNREIEDGIRQSSILEEATAQLQTRISEITALNQTLKEQNRIISSAGFGMWRIRLKEGAAPRMQANEKMAELLGIAYGTLTQEETYDAWYSRIAPEAVPSVQNSVVEMLETGFSENTYRWDHPVKGPIYVRCGGTSEILSDGTQLLSGYHADVTEIVAEEQRHRQELIQARDAAMLENEIISSISKLYFAIFRIDLTQNTYEEIASDDSVHIITGHAGSAQEKMNELCTSFVAPENYQEISEFFQLDTIQNRLRTADTVAAQYRASDGSWHEARFIVKKRDEAGDVTHILYVTRVISDEKQKELEQKAALEAAFAAAEQANEAKTLFLNSMSHDIRTPMNGIIGMTAIAGAHLNDRERVRECLTKISAASNHLLGLINEVLDVSRIESGRMELASDPFSLPDQLDALIDMMMPQASAKQQTFTVSVSDVIHENVTGDPARLQQVFTNVLGNAVKYTQPGGRISVELKELPSPNVEFAKFSFVCEDNGIGMTQETLDALFVPFERARDEEVQKIQGTGLGMVITRNIVHMMDGDIRVESRYHEGSKFTVTFLLRKQQTEISEYRGFEGMPVLIADDDAERCANTAAMLKSFGMVPDTADSGEAAIAMLDQKSDYQVCLTEWKLPGIDGIETVRQLRGILGPDVPMLLISLSDWLPVEMEARAAGVDDFIARPLFRSKLFAKLKQLFDRDDSRRNTDQLEMFEEKDFSDKRILLVEDNELNREIAEEILGMTGAAVESGENGEEALKRFEASEPGYYDMILMDIQMPVMDGRQAARAIRALDRPDALTMPIVAMSANAFVEDMRSSISAGMNAHIAKPIDFEKLMGVMEKYLGTRSRRNAPNLAHGTRSRINPAKYYGELYLTNGSTAITEETQQACVDVLCKNGAVGVIGLMEQKSYPIYCVSNFALTSLGYTYEELMEASDGKFLNLVHEDDRQRLSAEFYGKGYKYQYRMITKGGRIVWVTSYAADIFVMDGSKVRMLSMHVHDDDERWEEQLELNTRWQHGIIRAMEGSALYMYEFDVTTGLVGADIIGENGTNYTEVLGIQAPCRFDDLIRRSLVIDLRCSLKSVDGLETLNCKNLLDAFEHGETCPDVEFFYTVDQAYHRLTYYMSRDPASGHVMALVVCRDITEMKRREGR